MPKLSGELSEMRGDFRPELCEQNIWGENSCCIGEKNVWHVSFSSFLSSVLFETVS